MLQSSSSAVCGDCGESEPGWASINRGVFVCDECCSIHRLLGRHISEIRSITHGLWPPTLLEMVMTLVSKGANFVWEHLLLDGSHGKIGKRKPKAHHPVHPNKYDFVTAKYKQLAFVHRQSGKDHDQTFLEDLSQQLHASVRTGNLETCLRLLSLGAQVNFFHSERGNTPLHVAASAGQPLQVELLIVYGANPCALDSRGHTPVECARIAGYHELADRLIDCQYELTDRLAFYLCGRKPDHSSGEHYIIPSVREGVDVSATAVAARQKLHALTNSQFERLSSDVYDEVDRRETDAIWLATQNHSKLVSDHHIMPFLPVNPALSSTHNQGRQKLATFSKSEFAELLIDILTDAKRRQMESQEKGTLDGTVVPMDIAVRKEDVDDEDNDYDEVYIEETKESRHNSKAEANALARLAAAVNGEDSHSSATAETSDRLIEKESKQLVKQTATVSDVAIETRSEISKNEKTEEVRQEREDVVLINNHVQEASPSPSAHYDTVPAAKHAEVLQKLDTAQFRIEQLTKVNESMGEEIRLLQSMFQRLMAENSMLRQLQGKTISGSSTAPSRLMRATTAPVGELGLKQKVTSVRSDTTKERSEHVSDGRKKDTVEKDEVDGGLSLDGDSKEQSEKQQSEIDLRKDKHKPMVEKQQESVQSCDLPPALPVKKKRSRVLSVDTLPPSLSPVSLRAVQQQKEQNRLSLSGLSNVFHSVARQYSLPAVAPSLKTAVDSVIPQTEKITKRIQELLMAAQHGHPANFVPCSRRISSSVNDMASLFPQRPESEPVRAALRLLVSSATRLQQECKDVHNATVSSAGLEETPDVACLTQQVIQSAYDIAKAAKQLVTHSPELQ